MLFCWDSQKQQEMNKNKEIIVLDHKRSNAINIGMTKLPPPRSIKTAILKMDATIMNREGIEVNYFCIWLHFFFNFHLFLIFVINIIIFLLFFSLEIINDVTNGGREIKDTRGAGRQSRSSFRISGAVPANFGVDLRATCQIETLGF